MLLSKRIYFFLVPFLLFYCGWPAQTPESPANKSKKIAKIKTAFIYNFTKYVFWPREDQMKEFTICVMTSESMARQLKALGKLVKFRDRVPINVVFCRNVTDIRNCQIVVVDDFGKHDLWSVYEKIKGKGVLMIAENLMDYKKSMIAFTESDGRMKYIINRAKMEEANLVVKKLLYDLAITKEGEWHSLFEKLNSLVNSKENEVKVEKNDLAQILDMYNSLKKEKKNKDQAIANLEDSLRARLQRLDEKTKEYIKIQREIMKDRQTLYDQQKKISRQKKLLFRQDSRITKQRNVIVLIGALSVVVLLLLIFVIRSNNQRKIANLMLTRRKIEIEKQKQLVDEKQKEILDSINYARRIQKALMANDKLMNDHLREYFILFRPKDIVAGDFYWAAHQPDAFIYATGDSTGHGVPGAFMSLLNITKLNEAVNQKQITRPDLILNYVRENIIQALNPEGSLEESKDGMDAIVCRIDFDNLKLQYAAANSNFCIIRRREIINLKADKMPVGKSNDDDKPFTYNEIALEKGDMIYTFSDGYGDQFGGPKGKKFKHRILKEILVKISELSPETQRTMLERQLEDWMGHLEQVDDVLVIGVRV